MHDGAAVVVGQHLGPDAGHDPVGHLDPRHLEAAPLDGGLPHGGHLQPGEGPLHADRAGREVHPPDLRRHAPAEGMHRRDLVTDHPEPPQRRQQRAADGAGVTTGCG